MGAPIGSPFARVSDMSIFNESEQELIDAARMILSDGVRRVQSRQSLLPTSRNRAISKECHEAREAVAMHLVATYGPLRYETGVAVLIDAQGQLIAIEEFPRGKDTSCEMRPRLLAEYIVRHDASAVLLAHNHPSGHCAPSKADERLTLSMSSWLGAMNVDLVDHLVVTSADYCAIKGNW